MKKWRLYIVDDIQDGELTAGDPPFPDHHKKQERGADDPMGTPRLRKSGLKGKDKGQKRQKRGLDGDMGSRVAPGLDPGRRRRCRRHQYMGGGKLVFDGEGKRNGRAGCRPAYHKQFEPPWLQGIEPCICRKREQRRLVEGPYAVRARG